MAARLQIILKLHNIARHTDYVFVIVVVLVMHAKESVVTGQFLPQEPNSPMKSLPTRAVFLHRMFTTCFSEEKY